MYGPGAITHPRGPHGHRADAGLDRARRQVAVAHQAGAAHFVLLLPVLRKKLRHLDFNGLGQQLLCSLVQHFGQRVPDRARNPWILQLRYLIVVHAVYSLLAKGG